MAGGNFSGIGRAPRDSTPVLRWKNDSGETIPAFGAIKLQSYDAALDQFSAVKPDGSGKLHFVNGPKTVASGGYGESHLWHRSHIALTDGAFGDTVGPVDGSWEMTTAGEGFIVFSEPAGGVAAILRDGGGGTPGQIISFQIISSDPTIRSALVQIEQRSFPGTAYGSILDDTVVTVYDTAGCRLNEPNVDLTARRGEAVLMLVDDAAIATHWPDGYDVPEKYWYVLNLCCPQVICEE